MGRNLFPENHVLAFKFPHEHSKFPLLRLVVKRVEGTGLLAFTLIKLIHWRLCTIAAIDINALTGSEPEVKHSSRQVIVL